MEEYNIDEILKDMDKSMMKARSNGLILSDEQIEILNKYHFDYQKYSNLESLIYDIEFYLNENTELDDLEWVSSSLAELNYYNNTNK